MIYEKVLQVGTLIFELMMAFDWRGFCEHFVKTISIIWKLTEIWRFKFSNLKILLLKKKLSLKFESSFSKIKCFFSPTAESILIYSLLLSGVSSEFYTFLNLAWEVSTNSGIFCYKHKLKTITQQVSFWNSKGRARCESLGRLSRWGNEHKVWRFVQK